MRIHLRIDDANPTHTRFTVFVNGGNAGQLCLRNEEFDDFAEIVAEGICPLKGDGFKRTGHTWAQVQEMKKQETGQ